MSDKIRGSILKNLTLAVKKEWFEQICHKEWDYKYKKVFVIKLVSDIL